MGGDCILEFYEDLNEETFRSRLGQSRQMVFRQTHEELLLISHAANAWPMLRPVLIPAVSK